MLSDGFCVSLGSCEVTQCSCSVTAFVFLWGLVRALVMGVAPVPLPIVLLAIILPLLLRTPPVFVTLVLLRALRLVPVPSFLLSLFISSFLLPPSSAAAAATAALATPASLILLVTTSVPIILSCFSL